MLPQSKMELNCNHHAVIIRNDSLEDKFPGGLDDFKNRYRPDFNDHIAIHCVTKYLIWYTVRELESVGLVQGKDFITIDSVECEMWRMIHSEKVDRPFWFEMGPEWLRCEHWKGKVLVWYDG